MPRTFGSLSAYEPGLMDQARWWLQDKLTPVMGGDARRAGDFVQNKVMPTAEYLPGVGDAMAAGEAVDYFKQGQPIFGTLAAAGAAAGLVPGVGDAVQKGVKKGIRAYHGSPHDFDKFSLDKIGTGEGAQAYGHGLYFADSEGVARSYRDALSDSKDFTVGDKSIPAWVAKRVTGYDFIQNPTTETIDKVGLESARKEFAARLAESKAALEKGDWNAHTRVEAQQKILSALDDIEKGVPVSRPGRMYEVNINADPNDFLDWDKPLSEQPEGFFKALSNQENRFSILGPDGKFSTHLPLSKDQANEFIADFRRGYARQGGDPDDWKIVDLADKTQVPNRPIYEAFDIRSNTQNLAQQGIPGIKYLDAGSRSFVEPRINQTDKGFEVYWGNDPTPVDVFPDEASARNAAAQLDTRSRNYVVFDDALIEILRKYGLAGLGIGVGAGGFGSLAPQGQDNYQPPQL